MTGPYVFDAAYRPDLVRVKARGGIAINGYLTGIYAGTTTQPAQARAAGLGFVPTYEEGRSELVGASRAAGRRVGDKIIAAFKAKGIPIRPDIAVYPSVDVNVSAGQADSCNDAWQGIQDVIKGSISVRSYAEGAVIDALFRAGLLDGKAWLAAPTSWTGFNVNDPHICMVQLVGSSVNGTDENHLILDPHSLGAWWPDNSPYISAPTPPEETVSAQDVIDALKTAEGRKLVGDAVWGDDIIPIGSDPTNPTWAPSSVLRYMYANTTAILGALDPAKLAAAIVKALPPGGSLDQSQVQAACEAGVREVFAAAAAPPSTP